MPHRNHWFEERVALYEQAISELADSYEAALMDGDRPVMTDERSSIELIAEWRDPQARAQVEVKLLNTFGQRALNSYRAQMDDLASRELEILGLDNAT